MLKDKRFWLLFLLLFSIPLLLKSFILLLVILVVPIVLLISQRIVSLNDEKIVLVTLLGILFLFLINFISWAINSYSFLTLVWGIRTAYKFVVVYLFVSTSITISDKFFKKLSNLIILWTFLQAPLMIYQFYITGGDADEVVGTFAEHGTGVLAQFLTFSVIVTTFLYINKAINKITFFLILFISILGCAMAEIKMGFVSIALSLVLLFSFESKKLLKNFITIIIISIIFIYAYKWFVLLYPQHDFLSSDFISSYLIDGNYDSQSSINRFNFFTPIMNIYNGSIAHLLLGVGLGNASPSNFSFMLGEFYQQYGYFYHFDYFILPYYLIELGLLGLILYLGLQIVYPLIVSLLNYRKNRYGKIIIILIIIQILYVPYNINLIQYTISSIYWILIGLIINVSKKK